MRAGPTTQASNAIGAVAAAQMARILVNEYCFELAVTSSPAATDCVFVMSLSLARKARCAHRPQGSRSPALLRPAG
jgi:hypothetical protein